MKKFFLTAFTVVAFIGYTNANTNIEIEDTKQITVENFNCHSLASAMATLATVQGGNYYQAYFGAMAVCIGQAYDL